MIKIFIALVVFLSPFIANAQSLNFIRASQILDALHGGCGAIATGHGEEFLQEVDRQVANLLPNRPINVDGDLGAANLPPDVLRSVYQIASRRGLELVHLKVDDILRNDRGHFQKYQAHSLLLMHEESLQVAAAISYPSREEIYFGKGSVAGTAARTEALMSLLGRVE